MLAAEPDEKNDVSPSKKRKQLQAEANLKVVEQTKQDYSWAQRRHLALRKYCMLLISFGLP
jgi:hypothetical protein